MSLMYRYCRTVEETQTSTVIVEEIAVSFFNLLESLLRADILSSTSVVHTVCLCVSVCVFSINYNIEMLIC